MLQPFFQLAEVFDAVLRSHSMRTLPLICGALLLATPALGATIVLQASKDNTLFESQTGALSNGAGEFLYAGRVGINGNNLLRRGLLAFDVASALPSGATIETVTLTLRLSNANFAVPQTTISVHRVLADWGEGASNAGNPGGTGAASATGDATWMHRFFGDSLWSAPGGDFTPAASASRSVGGIGTYSFSSAQLAADVQAWSASPAGNFGWILRGDETTPGAARRFDSSENGSAANRPTLTIVYDPVPEPSAMLLTVCGFGLLVARSTRTGRSRRNHRS